MDTYKRVKWPTVVSV